MTATLMGAGLAITTRPRWMPRAGLVAALLVGTFIAVEAPVSGMSLNPARTLAPAVFSGDYTAIWLYFVAPVTGMLLAAEVFRRVTRASN